MKLCCNVMASGHIIVVNVYELFSVTTEILRYHKKYSQLKPRSVYDMSVYKASFFRINPAYPKKILIFDAHVMHNISYIMMQQRAAVVLWVML